MKGMNMMYSYKGKVAGMIIAGLGIVILIVQKLTGFTFIENLNADQHFNMLLWMTIFGLFTIMFSKEKIEDERVQAIRAKSLMYAFMMTVGAPLAFAFTVSLYPSEFIEPALNEEDMMDIARWLLYYPAIGVVLYLIMFHVGIYFDNVWDYEDKPWTPGTILQNKRNKLLVIIVSIAVVLLITLLVR